MKHRTAILLIALLVLGLLGSLTHMPQTTRATTPQATTAQVTTTTVASGLDSPRGMAFGPNNALYVTEAGIGGSGPCITASTEEEVCYGPTGAITRVDVGASTQARVVTGLPSLIGVMSGDATGPHDIEVFPDGRAYMVTGLGAPPERRSQLGEASSDFAQLKRMAQSDQITGVTNIADLATYEQANNPDESVLDTNPYALVSLPQWQAVVDAGANALLEIDNGGTVLQVTAFPTRTVSTPPPPPELPPQLPMESVPDAVTLGPDGAYYVGELTGFPFPVDGARIYRMVPGQAPDIYADGFTNIIDMTFDQEGNLYVLELAENGLLRGRGPSALIQVAPDQTRTVIDAGGVLTASTSLALSPEGGLYVANSGVMSGTGEILRLALCDSGDPDCQEPVALPSALSAKMTGAAEVDEDGMRGQGDPDGSGRAIITLNESAGEACVQATTSDIAQPNAAHIHDGSASVNGPPVVAFTDLIDGAQVSGCVAAEASLLQTIRDNPADYYLNIHNEEYPAGAVRGQLASREKIAVVSTLYLPYVAK
jgi:hypothetical protein